MYKGKRSHTKVNSEAQPAVNWKGLDLWPILHQKQASQHIFALNIFQKGREKKRKRKREKMMDMLRKISKSLHKAMQNILMTIQNILRTL